MKIRAFITQKKAEKASDCQDRFAVNKDTMMAAVSDGVSQSIFPDLWASLLVEHYTKKGQVTKEDRLDLCQQWRNLVQEYIEKEKAMGKNPWRTESNLAEGLSAGATLCGLKFTKDYHWVCDVLGDSCLIKIDDNSIEIFSSEDKAFDTYPDFLDSNPQKKGRGNFKCIEGNFTTNTKLILVSDPFSDFFYKLKEGNRKYIDELLIIRNHKEFVDLVAKWRSEGMHNDDSTVVILEWDGSSEFHMEHIDNIEELIKQEESDENGTTSDLNENDQETPNDELNVSAKSQNETGLKNEEIKEEIEEDVREEELSHNEVVSDVAEKKKTVEDAQNELIKQIPSFLDILLTKESKGKYISFKNILIIVFGRKEKKKSVLSTIFYDILTRYVKTLKLQNI